MFTSKFLYMWILPCNMMSYDAIWWHMVAYDGIPHLLALRAARMATNTKTLWPSITGFPPCTTFQSRYFLDIQLKITKGIISTGWIIFAASVATGTTATIGKMDRNLFADLVLYDIIIEVVHHSCQVCFDYKIKVNLKKTRDVKFLWCCTKP